MEVRQFFCLVRGGHRWQTRSDPAGSLTACARCGALRHGRTDSVTHGAFKGHTNLAADFSSLRPSHGPEELAADGHDEDNQH